MKYNRNLDNVEPYVVSAGVECNDDPKTEWLKLDWNESTIQPNPYLTRDINLFLSNEDLFHYPNTKCVDLIKRIADYNDISVDNILLFNGSDSALQNVFSCFINHAETEVCVFEPTYTQVFPFIKSTGGKIKTSKIQNIFTEHKYNFSDIEQSDIIYIVNPNNPTGFLIPQKTIIELLSKYRDKLFIVDEAYYEFSGYSMIKETEKYKNLIVTRTFSKAFSLAGIRLGYIATSRENIEIISKLRNSKEINSIAQICAISSLENVEYIRDFCKEVKKAREYFLNEMRKLDYVCCDSEANFVLMKVKNPISFIEFLKENKILIRDRSYLPGLQNCVRITIGNMQQTNRICDVIRKYKNE